MKQTELLYKSDMDGGAVVIFSLRESDMPQGGVAAPLVKVVILEEAAVDALGEEVSKPSPAGEGGPRSGG